MAKILLVEDDKSLREIYGVRLMAEGYEIVSAGDGEEALAMAIKERPDLIVSDVMMPKISGFDMLDILRSTSETKDVKVIMMTALSSEDQRARGEALGADRYLVKSQVGIEDVVRTVHDVLQDAPAPAAAPPTFPPVAAPSTPPTPAPTPFVTTPQPSPVQFEQTQSAQPNVPLQSMPIEQPLPTPSPASVPVTSTPPTPPVAPVTPFAPEPMPVSASTPPSASQTPPPLSVDTVVPPTTVTPIAPPPPVNPVATPAQTVQAPVPPTPVSPTPAPSAPIPPTQPLPEPIAPFSTPAPASLGERVIEPLNDINAQSQNDFANQMQQALSTPVDPQQTPPVQ